MRILIICNRIPYPLKDGGVKAIDQMIKGYVQNGHEVDLACINTSRHLIDISDLTEFYHNDINLHTAEVNTDVKAIPALIHLIQNKSYNLSRFISKDFENLILDLLIANAYDVIQLEGLFVCPYIDIIRKNSKAIIALRNHNIEYQIWDRLSKNEKNPIKKWYLKKLTHQLKKFELEQYKKVDTNICISPIDMKYIEQNGGKNNIWIPFALNTIPPFNELPNNANIGFLASLEWMPNIEGLDWFLENVWYKIIENNKSCTLHIAGRGMPSKYEEYQSGQIKVHGEIEDIEAYYHKMDIMIVPLFSGSGMRIKIIESMAYSKAIVSTTIGAEGIPCTAGENIIIEDDARKQAEAILDLLSNSNKINSIAKNAHDFVQTHFDSKVLISKLVQHYQKLNG